MYPIWLALLLSTLGRGLWALPHHIHGSGEQERISQDQLTSEVRNALRDFCVRAVQNYAVVGATSSQKSVFVDPLALGTLWAVVQERMFDVETEDLLEELQLPEGRISSVYALLNNYLNQDHRHTSTNAIYSDMSNVTATSGFQKLRTYFKTVDFRAYGNQVVEEIQQYTRDHTNGKVDNQLLPKDAPFYNSTRGVILSTASYAYNFENPFIPGDRLEFQSEDSPGTSYPVDSVQAAGEFKIFRDENVTIVVLPFKSEEGESNKSLVLVHPQNLEGFLARDFPSLIKKVDTISRHESTKLPIFQPVSSRIRLPLFQFTAAKVYQEASSVQQTERSRKRNSSAICLTDTKHASFLQHPVQISSVSLDANSLSVAVAIGVQVDNVEEYRKEFGASPLNDDAGEETPTTGIPTQSTPGSTSQKSTLAHLRSGLEVQEEQQIYVHVQSDRSARGMDIMDESSGETKSKSRDLPPQDVVINSPFLVALHDYEIGMHAFAVISRPQDQAPIGREEKFTEYCKLKRWVCLPPPAPFDETSRTS